jgi:epoxyqueuosine reductase QueG
VFKLELEKDLRSIIEKECEDYFLGMVDLSNVKNSLTNKYISLITEYPRAISVGITLPEMILDGFSASTAVIYKETSSRLKLITSHMSHFFEKNGYKALPMPTSKNLNDKMSFHKAVAYMANLGEIKNNILITPEVGPRVKWGTILTDAPIKYKRSVTQYVH